VPEEVINDLLIYGSPEQCRARIAEYIAAGVATPIITPFPMVGDPMSVLNSLFDLSSLLAA